MIADDKVALKASAAAINPVKMNCTSSALLIKPCIFLINSLTLNSVQKQATSKSQVAIYLGMVLRSFGFLDWSKWKQLIDKGYQQTKDYFASLPAQDRFWK